MPPDPRTRGGGMLSTHRGSGAGAALGQKVRSRGTAKAVRQKRQPRMWGGEVKNAAGQVSQSFVAAKDVGQKQQCAVVQDDRRHGCVGGEQA